MQSRLTEVERLTWLQEQMDLLIADAPVKVYAASNSPLIPYRLANAKSYRPNQGYRSRELILDSGIGHDIGNHEVLKAALKLGDTVNWVVPKDYANDMLATLESLKEFKTLVPSQFEERILIPIQGSTPEEYLESLKRSREIFPEHTYFGIGGIAGANLTKVQGFKSLTARIQLVQYILDNVGNDITFHLFGCTSIQWKAIYGDERVVSCDSARFWNQAKSGYVSGKHAGIVSFYGIAHEWLKFLMEITTQQNPTNQATFDDLFD